MRDVKGYEGIYSVTSCGKVWSHLHNRFLTPHENHGGYAIVYLSKNGRTINRRVHRLVAEAYLPACEGKSQINHKDENKANNCVNNLEWVTAKENCNHGTRLARLGDLTSKPVVCVELGRRFRNAYTAAEELGIQQSNINRCLKGNRERCGGYHWRYAS